MSRSLNIWFSVCAMVALLMSGSAARAQATKRVAIKDFTGPSAGAFQAQVTQGLKRESQIELVSARELKSTASRLGSDLDSPSSVQEVGEALELSAIVEGEVVKKGRGLQATVRVRNVATGQVEHEEVWTKRRSQVKTIKPLVGPALGPAIRKSSPPAPKVKPKPKTAPIAELDEEEEEPAPKPVRRPRPAPRDDEEDDEERAEEKKPRRPGKQSVTHPALVASVGPRLMWRTLKYEGDTNLSSYKNPGGSPAVALALSAQYYPGAHSSTEWYSNLGLDVDLDYVLGLKSKLEGEELDTSAYEFGVGAIYRIPLGDFEPRIRLGYVKHAFEIDGVPDGTFMPGVSYSAVRIGVGTAIRFVDWLSFDVNFAYLLVLGAGELDEQKFGDDADTGAWEAGAGFLLRFKEQYGVRFGLDYRRYGYDFGNSFNPPVILPKTGTDGYLRMTLSFVYSMPGAI